MGWLVVKRCSQEIQSNKLLKGDGWFSKGGSSGDGEGFTLMAMQNVLLDMKEKVDFML